MISTETSKKASSKPELYTVLCAAFPGTGKSWYVDKGEGSGYMPQGFATDSDSSKFDKDNFPQNYIEHIKKKIMNKQKDNKEADSKPELYTVLYFSAVINK